MLEVITRARLPSLPRPAGVAYDWSTCAKMQYRVAHVKPAWRWLGPLATERLVH
jgi:hypothetical protein